MFFQINDLQLHYEIVGKGKPLLILHGLAGNLTTMKAVYEPIFTGELNTRFQRIYVDLPGMGNSNGPDDFASSEAILEALIIFSKTIINTPFLLVGYSYGGYLARAMVLRGLEIEGLSLVAPMVIPERKERVLPKVEWFYETDLYKNSQVKYDEFCKINNNHFLEKLSEKYALNWDILKTYRYKFPSLILLGQQDSIVGFSNQMSLISDYPRSTLAILDMAGHNLQIEQYELFTYLTKDWLKRCEEIE
ncbi:MULTISPECIES: alpha/beta hydrolase [Lactococcus]|uniref:Hydrolase alpha/beta fold family n=1 Tax=Lactococcus lactis subsp. cremoris TaxID=1359 RepID=A0A166IWJ7_LACLC|nr:alpha/beta hydrolase [Lactococcus cremoris]KZK05146.1 hydrolase alpha/beta fold family [Lactococcus cremoris]